MDGSSARPFRPTTRPLTLPARGPRAMTSKPLSDAVKKGFAYLINQQHAGGGWCQGGGWRMGTQGSRVEGPNVEDPADVANTCVAALPLRPCAHTRRDAEHLTHVRRGLAFIVPSVERSETESLYVTDLRGTQVQHKIGEYVDTFLTAMVLAEAKGQMPDDAGETRLSAALDKVIAKVERHQQADGTWDLSGWAPVVGYGLASAGLNRAKQRGAKVSDEVLQRAEKSSRARYDRGSKSYGMGGSAGVPLYSTASHLGSRQKTVDSYQAEKMALKRALAAGEMPAAEAVQAKAKVDYLDDMEVHHDADMRDQYEQLQSAAFVSGFGSNGGEEFLSYLHISESLLSKGGKEWEDWDRKMTENLERVQNADGSWAGHHCITGRSFCTATALLVLMADRAPRPDAVVEPTVSAPVA